MSLNDVKNQLSINSKNGISFLSAGAVIWLIITFIFLLPYEIRLKNLYALYTTGLMFPLSILISKLINVDWKAKSNPLGMLGLILNLGQFLYFPLIIWALITSPNEMLLFFAIVTGAHFFPYGWLYNAKIYYILSPAIVLIVFTAGLMISGDYLWIIPFTMVILLIFSVVFLYYDYKNKVSNTSSFTKDLSV